MKVEKAYITVHGDPSVGIPDSYFEATCFIDTECYPDPTDATDTVEEFRKRLKAAYDFMEDMPVSVMFDFELGMED